MNTSNSTPLRDRLIKALRTGPTDTRANMADYLMDVISELRERPASPAFAAPDKCFTSEFNMARTFLSFGFDTRFDIANDLDLIRMGDSELDTPALCKAYFKRAVDMGKVEELRSAIARAHERLRGDS